MITIPLDIHHITRYVIRDDTLITRGAFKPYIFPKTLPAPMKTNQSTVPSNEIAQNEEIVEKT